MDEIRKYLLFTVIEGGLCISRFSKFGPTFLERRKSFFMTNTCLKKLSNLVCRRLVTESWFWTFTTPNGRLCKAISLLIISIS